MFARRYPDIRVLLRDASGTPSAAMSTLRRHRSGMAVGPEAPKGLSRAAEWRAVLRFMTSVILHQVAVIRAGFSGLCMAIRFKHAGIDDFHAPGARGADWPRRSFRYRLATWRPRARDFLPSAGPPHPPTGPHTC